MEERVREKKDAEDERWMMAEEDKYPIDTILRSGWHAHCFYSTLCLYALYSTYTNYFAAHNLTFSCNTYMNIEPRTPRDRHRTGLSRPTDHLQNAALVYFRVYLCMYVCMYVNMHFIYVYTDKMF